MNENMNGHTVPDEELDDLIFAEIADLTSEQKKQVKEYVLSLVEISLSTT